MSLLVAFGHQSGVGKDAAVEHLVENHGFSGEQFARNLKSAAKTVFRLSDRQLYGDKKEVVDPRWGMTPREILQKFGTDAMRGTFGPDVWIQSLQSTISSLVGDEVDVAISDCRFLSEAQAVKRWGGYLVKVDRPGRTLPANPNHPSETELADYDGWDAVIENTGTLEEFYESVDTTLAYLLAMKGE